MSLVGNLEDLGLGEILQIVSLSRRSGVLSLESRGREARIIFRNGQVIRASSSSFQQNLGEVLIQKGVIDLPTLKRALSIQADEGYSQLLGVIIVERFGISAEAIEGVLREQIENVVYSLFAWAEGTFEFELQEMAEENATRFDPAQFLLRQGLNPQYLAMEGSRIIDEQRHRGEGGDEEHPEHDDSHLDFAFDLLQEPSTPASEKHPQHRLPPIDASVPAGGDLPAGHPRSSGRGGAAASAEASAANAAFAEASAADAAFAEAPAANAAPALTPSGLPAATPGQPLVLVDDDQATLDALALLLDGHGYQVDPLAMTEDALIRIDNLYRGGIRPMVVVDLIMPRMDGTGILGGLELMELVRANFPDLPILAVTDYPNDEAQRKLRGMGIPLLDKPLKGQLEEAAESFGPKFLQTLARLKPAQSSPSGADRVNIGDELRLEMGEEPAIPAPHHHQSTGISHLRGMLEELNDPQLGGGIILLVLRFASEFMNRAVVLLVKKESIQGLGQFGLDNSKGDADSRVRNLRIPRDGTGVFHPVLENRFAWKGPIDEATWQAHFAAQLGEAPPVEVFVGPIVSEGKVVAVLYGDNLPEQKPIGDTDSLEIFLGQAGIAMEKALLQRRLQDHGQRGM